MNNTLIISTLSLLFLTLIFGCNNKSQPSQVKLSTNNTEHATNNTEHATNNTEQTKTITTNEKIVPSSASKKKKLTITTPLAQPVPYKVKPLAIPLDTNINKNILVRQPDNTTSYAHNKDDIAKIIDMATKAEQNHSFQNSMLFGNQTLTKEKETNKIKAIITPHDDHRYIARVNIHGLKELKANHVIVIGVNTNTNDANNLKNSKLVFDSFDFWHGPYKNVKVSPLRNQITKGLSNDDYVIDNQLHSKEHSIEAIIPFLQHYNQDVTIIPILIPPMSLDKTIELSNKMASILKKSLSKQKLKLKEDVAIVITGNTVNYGDQGWKNNNADLGTDKAGYDAAVKRDINIIKTTLLGALTIDRIKNFWNTVTQKDYHKYNTAWNGRFSIPFGLLLLHNLYDDAKRKPRGKILRYATTVYPGSIDPKIEGLDFTNPANLNHWVGFSSIVFY